LLQPSDRRGKVTHRKVEVIQLHWLCLSLPTLENYLAGDPDFTFEIIPFPSFIERHRSWIRAEH